MAQFNADAINYPFGGLHIVLIGDFSQLNLIGKNLIYDQNLNALWNVIYRVIFLDMKNHRFSLDGIGEDYWKECIMVDLQPMI